MGCNSTGLQVQDTQQYCHIGKLADSTMVYQYFMVLKKIYHGVVKNSIPFTVAPA